MQAPHAQSFHLNVSSMGRKRGLPAWGPLFVRMPRFVLGLLGCLAAIKAEGTGLRLAEKHESTGRIEIVLDVERPSLKPVMAKDGNTYTDVRLEGCGQDNEFGFPAVPVVVQEVEIPENQQAKVVVEGMGYQVLSLGHPILPVQPPVPKERGALTLQPFVIDREHYDPQRAGGLEKAKNGQTDVRQFRRRGRDYVSVVARPFTYDTRGKKLGHPARVRITVDLSPRQLPAAAGPRKGAVHVVEVLLRNRADLDHLVDGGYDIGGLKDGRAKVYATEEEAQRLRNAGFSVEEKEIQPKATPAPAAASGGYNSYDTLTARLVAYAAAYSNICRVVSLGQSVEGRELWAMKITDNPGIQEDEPGVKYVGAMHGDESLGAEMCLSFIDLLLTAYGQDTRIADLVNETEIWIVPLMNPDGLEHGTRYNAGGYDLNRSFPEGSAMPIGNVLYGPAMDTAGRPPEVVRIMEWSAAESFVLSANFHTGALVVNYPYDNDGMGSVFSPTPDESLFQALATAYSMHNPPMYASTSFTHGIVNGATWYAISGGMQDWNYRYLGCNEVTIELSDTSQPGPSEIPRFWSQNQESMLAYLESAHAGARGVVTDADTGAPVFAAVRVAGNEHLVFTDPDVGDYHRMLLPGTYDLVFSSPGYETETVPGVTVQEGAATRVNVTLTRTTGGPTVILVSHDSMRAGVLEYKAAKESEGFSVEEIVLSGVPPSAKQLRDQIRAVYQTTGAEFLILVGDLGQIPTAYYGSAPSDLLYGLMDPGEGFGDYLGKDMMVGRISLESGGEVSAYTAKLASFLAGSDRKTTFDLTWVSHGYSSSEYDVAEGTHNWVMANAIPPGCQSTLFYRSNGSAAELSAHIDSGTDAVIYSGHGGTYGWARYDYNVDQLRFLANNVPPIVIGHCCIAGQFGADTCFGEAWLETTSRGVVYVGASNNTYWDQDDVMEKGEFSAMNADRSMTIGAAIDAGLHEVHVHYPGTAAGQSEYYYAVYHVFGDPTVRMLADPGLVITTPSPLPAATVGQAYAVSLTALGGTEPYSWRILDGALPAGLSLTSASPAADITGSPTQAGVCTFTVEVEDAALGRTSRLFEMVVDAPRVVIHSFPLDGQPKWKLGKGWQFGRPAGQGSHNGDPMAAHTGKAVFGFRFDGDYTNKMRPSSLVTQPLNCSGYQNVVLEFWRWLGVEGAPRDYATIEASNDGINWQVVWTNPESDISDSAWQPMSVDISSIANNRPSVYIRWTMGPTDRSVTFPGWNIDDITLTGIAMSKK